MSIEIEKPETVYGKLDAIGNLIEQMYLASSIGDKERFKYAHKLAGEHVFNAMRQMEELGIEDK